jgi:TRAP-type C4-dicarboxylate transport system permease small subunit
MILDRFYRFLDGVNRILGRLSNWFNWCAGAALVVMMVMVNANVLLRPFGMPIWGTFEIVGFMGSVVLSFALLQTTFTRSHMAVALITSRLPAGARGGLELFNRLVGLLITSLVAWQCFRYATQVRQTGEGSSTLNMPFYPFIYGIGIAFGLAALMILVDVLRYPVRRSGS